MRNVKWIEQLLGTSSIIEQSFSGLKRERESE